MRLWPKRLSLQIFVPHFLLICGLLFLAFQFSSATFNTFFLDKSRTDLKEMAIVTAESIKGRLASDREDEIQSYLNKVARRIDSRITVIDTSGVVIADTDFDETSMDNHSNRPEIIQANTIGVGSAIRYSITLKQHFLYVAIPIEGELGYVRTSFAITALKKVFKTFYLKLISAGAFIVLLIGILSFYIAQRLSQPIKVLQENAKEYAKGDFSKTILVPDTYELKDLAGNLNEMANKLDKIDTTRKEFVANVSHELRTPITLIQGFVETLIEEENPNPEDTKRFLTIIKQHTNRMSSIITDLLLLATTENDQENKNIERKLTALDEVIDEAVENCVDKAKNKKITIKTEIEPEIKAKINTNLLGQAVINLLNNAIQYSPKGAVVTVKAFTKKGKKWIQVIDNGPGIEKEHLKHLFRRFYRTDRARSRKLGGTGLGLSIVKHIAKAQGGDVKVESKLNQGSTFTMILS